jgi:hypothetical protein
MAIQFVMRIGRATNGAKLRNRRNASSANPEGAGLPAIMREDGNDPADGNMPEQIADRLDHDSPRIRRGILRSPDRGAVNGDPGSESGGETARLTSLSRSRFKAGLCRSVCFDLRV